MSKTLPEGMGDPEYRMVMERKQRRMVEIKGKSLVETNPPLIDAVKEEKLEEILGEAVEVSKDIEKENIEPDFTVSGDSFKIEVDLKEKKILKNPIKKRGRPPLKKGRR